MKDDKKTKKELIQELQDLRARVSVLEASESNLKVQVEALQENDRRYRALSTNPLTLLYVNDAQGVFHDANDSALELLGYTRDELGQVSFGDIVHPEDYAKVLERQSEELSGGRPEGPLELRLIATSGEQVWVEAYGYALGGDGESWRALGVAHNITGRKRVEEALRESEERYRLLEENVTDVIWTGDMNLRTTYISPSITHQRGYTVEEAMAQTINDMMPPDCVESMTETLAEGLAADEAGQGPPEGRRRAVAELYCKDGSTIWAEVHGRWIRDSEGKIVGILGVTRDITDRKRAEEALRDSEKRFRALTECASDGISVVDADGTVVFESLSLERILGYEVTGHIGGNVFDLVHPEDMALTEEAFQHVLLNPTESLTMVLRIRDAEGSWHWMECTGRNLLDDPVVGGVVINYHDITERKQAEEALRDSEERFRGVFDSVPTSVIVVDKDGQMVDINPYHVVHIGRGQTTKEDYLGKNIATHPSIVSAGLSEAYRRVLQGEPFDQKDVYFPTLTGGTDGYFNVKGAPLFKNDEVIGAVVAHEDITERKRMEEALRESEERHRLFFESSPIGIIHYNNQGVITAVNDAAVDIFGSSHDKLIGLAVKEIAHVELADAVFKSLNGEVGYFEGEYTSYTAGKTSIIKNSSTPIICDGEVIAGVGMIEDITERKRAEEKFRSLVENAPALIVIADREGKIGLINRTVPGVSPGDAVGKSVFEYVSTEHHDEIRRCIEYVFETGETCDYEVAGAGPEDTIAWYSTRVGPIWSEGQVIAATLICTDITERKKAEQALQTYSERLEEMVEARTKALRDAQEQLVRQERLATLGQLAGSVSHELRNPLGAIKNAAYFLNMALENPEPEVKETLRILEAEVTISDRIIGTLLEFARPKPGVWRGLKINDLIQSALSRTTVPGNIEVVSQLDESLPEVLGDPDQIGQVFGNIVLNAIQAMTEGGRLVIKSEAPSLEWVSVSFADAGGGIPEDRLGKIFEPLFTTKARGIGLGLALSKSIVERHGGTIEVQSKAGKGSTFTVGLPVGGGEWGSERARERER